MEISNKVLLNVLTHLVLYMCSYYIVNNASINAFFTGRTPYKTSQQGSFHQSD